jgi:peptide chain release factor subunit 1
MDLAILQGVHVETKLHEDSIVPSKQDRGGQSQRRFDKNRDLAIIAWYKSSAEKIDKVLLDEDLAGIIISGPGLTKNEFYLGEYLHHELRKKILGVIDTGYVGVQGIKETIGNAGELLAESELVKQRKLMSTFFRRLANDDRVSYGKNVLEELRNGKVDTLLLSNVDKGLENESVAYGTKIEYIDSGFEEGAQLEKIFGGIGALLRY